MMVTQKSASRNQLDGSLRLVEGPTAGWSVAYGRGRNQKGEEDDGADGKHQPGDRAMRE